MAVQKNKTIEEKYKHLDEISHILLRPGMFIGSIKNEPKSFFLYNPEHEQLELREIEYVPALLKLCDEVISNSCDEYRRPTNMGLTHMLVSIDNTGFFKVRDNGGIPVVMHKEAKMMLPDFIFGQLRTSSNYDDTESRDVVGTNGLGNKLSAIFSKLFTIQTADGKKKFFHSWSDNMRKDNNDMKTESCKEHFTESQYVFDLQRFEDISELSDDFIDLIEKRCIDAAAANPGLTVTFQHREDGELIRESEWKFDSFDEYIALYSNYVDESTCIHTADKQKSIWFFPDGNINIGFVNGAECSSGTHIKAIHGVINDAVANYITTKKKLEIQSRYVDGKYSTFCMMHVDNPSYDSQTKDTLTTPINKFDTHNPDYQFTLPKKFTDEVCKSDLIDIVVDWYKQKQEVENEKELRKINKEAKKKLVRNDKYIPANSKNSFEKELWIFEGDSAQAGFRQARNPQTQAAFLLRGNCLNSQDASIASVMKNAELRTLIQIIGLQWGQVNKREDLNFGRIIIATDADPDGDKIAAILLVFFNKFPELFEYKMIARSITPIIVAKGKGKMIKIYSLKEAQERENELKGLEISYLKGLASQNSDLYASMMKTPILQFFKKDELSDATLQRWFGKGIAKERREILKIEV